MKIIKCKLLGYCHGVSKTMEKADYCLELARKSNKVAYSIGNLVHNEDVVKHYSEKGMEVIQSPEGHESGIALVRAHGITPELEDCFRNAGFELIDSTCSNILRSFDEIRKAFENDRNIIVIGMKNHAETNSLMGVKKDSVAIPKFLVSCMDDLKELEKRLSSECSVSVIVQTTFPQNEFEELSDEIKCYFKDSEFRTKLCAECVERKKQVEELSKQCDVLVVIGSENSANTQDLVRFAKTLGKPVFSFSNLQDIKKQEKEELCQYGSAGICSGTSTPDSVIEPICSFLSDLKDFALDISITCVNK